VNAPMTPEYGLKVDGKEAGFIDLKIIPQNKD